MFEPTLLVVTNLTKVSRPQVCERRQRGGVDRGGPGLPRREQRGLRDPGEGAVPSLGELRLRREEAGGVGPVPGRLKEEDREGDPHVLGLPVLVKEDDCCEHKIGCAML